MDRDTGTSDRDLERGRSNNESFGSGTNQPGRSTTGVDLKHPSKAIDGLADVDKRFLAGMVREGIIQGLEECQRTSGSKTDYRQNVLFADRWIGTNVPFLAGVIGDAGPGTSSGR